ncbi:hypothetical protein ASE27_10165 [Oerskovia sp. Root918]|uniref:DUF6093 family protein n=1 Tax=Oerskovia sp. Root918 TaxID=1736607 RepID=UPI0006F33606|nr:DUF6093 family protein [Oerskovia sp. Root918]KRD36811.1 hypothetical protein ASE27_10165 [Oerskovia sp. Root918]
MSAGGAIARGRRMAERLMVDTCLVQRVVGETTNEETGAVEPLLETVYSGPCKLQNQSQYEMGAEAGGHMSVEQRSLVHFPVGSFQVRHGDLCTFTASVAPGVAGQKYRLQGETPYRTFETAYRVYAVQEVA